MSAAERNARDVLGSDLTVASTHVLCRSEQIRSAAALMGDAVCELSRDSSEDDVRDAVEAVNASALRVLVLVLEATAEAGRMTGVASARSVLPEEVGS